MYTQQLKIRMESDITPEPGPQTESDQVRESATSYVAGEVIVELEG